MAFNPWTVYLIVSSILGAGDSLVQKLRTDFENKGYFSQNLMKTVFDAAINKLIGITNANTNRQNWAINKLYSINSAISSSPADSVRTLSAAFNKALDKRKSDIMQAFPSYQDKIDNLMNEAYALQAESAKLYAEADKMNSDRTSFKNMFYQVVDGITPSGLRDDISINPIYKKDVENKRLAAESKASEATAKIKEADKLASKQQSEQQATLNKPISMNEFYKENRL